MDLGEFDPEAQLLAVWGTPDPYQHTNTDTGGRILGVIIHGAIRNVTVSVKMGVSGMPWAWERGGTPQSHTGWVLAVLVSLLVGETNNHTFIEHLLYAGNCAKCCLSMCVWGCVCSCYVDVYASAHDAQKRASDPLGLGSHANVRCPSVWCWRTNSALLEQQQALLTAEPPFRLHTAPCTNPSPGARWHYSSFSDRETKSQNLKSHG